MSIFPRTDCRGCGNDEGEDRYSLGIYYSRLCDACWAKCGARKDGAEAFDPLDAGESYESEDPGAW